MLKNWTILLLVGALLASCTPYPPDYRSPYNQPPAPLQSPEEIQRQKLAADQALQEKRAAEEAARRAAQQKKQEATDAVPKPEAAKPRYPTATSIPGKSGHVFNPYTNDPVDVRGIPSGSLVTDPNDAQARKFRVP